LVFIVVVINNPVTHYIKGLSMATYYHLCANVNGEIKDVLVSAETFGEEGEHAKDYFLHGATEITNHGEVEIEGGFYLPDVIG